MFLRIERVERLRSQATSQARSCQPGALRNVPQHLLRNAPRGSPGCKLSAVRITFRSQISNSRRNRNPSRSTEPIQIIELTLCYDSLGLPFNLIDEKHIRLLLIEASI